VKFISLINQWVNYFPLFVKLMI